MKGGDDPTKEEEEEEEEEEERGEDCGTNGPVRLRAGICARREV